MADKKAAPKKKPVSKTQATSVANFLKGQKGGMGGGTDNGPKLPSNKSNPVTTYDDNDQDDEQGA